MPSSGKFQDKIIKYKHAVREKPFKLNVIQGVSYLLYSRNIGYYRH
jgi:hypothetical protein